MKIEQKTGLKEYVIDTSVVMHDPECTGSFKEHDVTYAYETIVELDRIKPRLDQTGKRARAASAALGFYEKAWSDGDGVVKMPGGGLLCLVFTPKRLPKSLGQKVRKFPYQINDQGEDAILRVALMRQMMREQDGVEVILVSKYPNLRLRARGCGIIAQDYKNDKVPGPGELYTGTTIIDTFDAVPFDVITHLRSGRELPMQNIQDALRPSIILFPNQCCVFRQNGHEALAVYKKQTNSFHPVLSPKIYKGIKPTNVEQQFLYHLLRDKTVPLVTITGEAGSGKTLLALEAAVESALDIIIARPTWEVGQPMGFLPGDVYEKMAPWMQPIRDALEKIHRSNYPERETSEKTHDRMLHKKYFDELIDRNILELRPIAYIQGQTWHNRFAVVDEMQNCTPHEAKMIVTRPGVQTKLVLEGDPTQIRDPFLDPESNGLSYIVERMKESTLAAHIHLVKSERSPLVEEAIRLL